MNEGDISQETVSKIIDEIVNCHRVQFRLTPKMREKFVRIVQSCGYLVNGYSAHDVMRAFLLWQLDAACKHLQPVHIREKLIAYLGKRPKRGRPAGTPKFL